MARQTWMGVGVAAVGMALVLGVPQGAAQDQGQSSGMMSASSQAENEAEYRLQIAQLRTQVAQLQQQLTQMRAQVAQNASAPSNSSQGVGGSGSAGTSAVGDPNAEAPQGATGIGYATGGVGGSGSAGTAPASDDSGFALANILHTGRVKSITSRSLVLTEEKGVTTTLSLAREVEVLENGRPIALGRLAEGTRVRTSAPLTEPGNPVVRIEILPSR